MRSGRARSSVGLRVDRPKTGRGTQIVRGRATAEDGSRPKTVAGGVTAPRPRRGSSADVGLRWISVERIPRAATQARTASPRAGSRRSRCLCRDRNRVASTPCRVDSHVRRTDDGRTYYVDTIKETTSWELPGCEAAPPGTIEASGNRKSLLIGGGPRRDRRRVAADYWQSPQPATAGANNGRRPQASITRARPRSFGAASTTCRA